MRKLVVVLTATATIVLASSVAWKADAQTATGTVVEMVLKPCDPGVPRNQCGVSIHVVKGSATFDGTNIQQGEVLNVNGNGELTQSTPMTRSLISPALAKPQGALALAVAVVEPRVRWVLTVGQTTGRQRPQPPALPRQERALAA